MQKVKLLALILIVSLYLRPADTAQGRMEKAELKTGDEFSTVEFSFQTPVSYSIVPDPAQKTVTIIVPANGINPVLDFKSFEDKRVQSISFLIDERANAVARIVLKDVKTSIYHSLSKNKRLITVRLKSRKRLMALKTDISKKEALEAKKKKDIEIIKKMKTVSVDSGRKAYKKAMENFQKNLFKDSVSKFDKFLKKYPKSIYRVKAVFTRAEALYRISKKDSSFISSAIESFRLAIAAYPGSESVPRARLRIGDLYGDDELFIEALATYEGLVKSSPNSKFALNALLGKAAVYLKGKEFTQAFNEFERILLLFPAAKEVRAARFKIAEAFYLQKNYKTAVNMFEDSDKKWPTFLKSNSVPLSRFADAYFRLGKYKEAFARYVDLVNLFPNSDFGKEALNRMGDIYVKWNRPVEAIKIYGFQVRQIPEEKFGIESRLRLAALGHSPDKVIKEKDTVIWPLPDYFNPEETYREIIEKFPDTDQSRDALYQKARLMHQQKRYVNSIWTLKKMMKDFPATRSWPPAIELVKDNLFTMVSKYHDQEGYLILLSTYYENFDPFFADIKDPATLAKVGDAYYELGLYPRSLEKFRLAEKFDEEGVLTEELTFKKGRALAGQGSYDEAEKILKPFLDKMDSSRYAADAVHLLGDIYSKKGEDKKAINVYKSAISLNRRHSRVSKTAYYLGLLYKNRENYRQAAVYFTMAINSYRPLIKREDPYHVKESHYQLLEAYYRDRMYRDAIAIADRVVARYPKNNQNDWALYAKSDSQAKLNKDEKSVESLKALVKEDSGSIYARVAAATVDNLGWKAKHKSLFVD